MVVRSRTEQLRFLGPIQSVLAVTVVVTMLLAVVLSYAVARTITRPLAAITDVMREVAATGDLTRKIPPPAGRWDDEDARLLATTFNTLTDSIARFQREVSQRERLSSLGRLSTRHRARGPQPADDHQGGAAHAAPGGRRPGGGAARRCRTSTRRSRG